MDCLLAGVVTMSEDEDEELAMLRLQALMSKRRGGAGTSKDLPIPPLLLSPTEPIAPVTTEAPLPIPPAVVTSAPVTVTDPTEDVSNNGGAYRHPRFVRGQASHCSSNGSSSTIRQIPNVFNLFQRDGINILITSCLPCCREATTF